MTEAELTLAEALADAVVARRQAETTRDAAQAEATRLTNAVRELTASTNEALSEIHAGEHDADLIDRLLERQARLLDAIEVAITSEDGLDGLDGERLLRECGRWPARTT